MKNTTNLKHIRHWLSILTVMALSVASVNFNAGFLKTSVILDKQHKAFDGTVYPIQNIPDWTHITSADREKTYHDIDKSKLISIPEYKNDYLTFPSSSLIWGKSEHDLIRNAKITYPVAYTGSYNLNDGGEGKGSHPAVDIKALAGTPIHAVANGVVYKVGNQTTGFGNYVVIEHRNVPHPNNSNLTTTLYSGYAHLSKIFVSEGEVMEKNQIIGEVGTTGASTTNHLHFQLDSNLAPWHLYWPFTYAETQKAGYSFWEAVSAGLNKENVYAYTYNPMKWVQNNLNTTVQSTVETVVVEDVPESIESTAGDEVTVEIVVEEVTENSVSEMIDLESDESVSAVVNIGFQDVEFENTSFILIGNNDSIQVKLLDENGEVIEKPQFDGEIQVSVSDESIAQVSPNFLKEIDFNDGSAELKVYANREGEIRLNLGILQRDYESLPIGLINQVKPFARFGITVDGQFTPRVAEKVIVQALDEDGNPTPSFNNAGTIELGTIMGSGTFSKDELTRDDFRSGQAEVLFYGDSDEDVIIQSLYGKAKAQSRVMDAKLFTDLSSANDFYDAVSYLYKKGTIQGYPDGTFQDTKTVSRVEALKFIFSGLNLSTKDTVTVSFKDAFDGQWYSNYVATASNLGIVEGYPDGSFKPSQGVNRVEFLKILLKAMDISVDPIVSDDPYPDVDKYSWFAPYVQYAKEKNLYPLSGSKFEASTPMSRGEVAEVIFRMLMIDENEATKYTTLLKPL